MGSAALTRQTGEQAFRSTPVRGTDVRVSDEVLDRDRIQLLLPDVREVSRMHIEQRLGSKRSPVILEQAQLFSALTRDLMHAYERSCGIGLEEFFQLPEYRKFVVGAYACGFVCRDYSPMDGDRFELLKSRPREHLGSCAFRVLRHWVHMLLRAERWADGWSSHVREALLSGALEVIATRLESDQSLKEPEVVEILAQ